MTNYCKGCTIRTPGCHDRCEAYKAFKQFQADLKKKQMAREEEIFKNTLLKLFKFFIFNQNGTEASYSMSEIEDVIREFAEINGVEL